MVRTKQQSDRKQATPARSWTELSVLEFRASYLVVDPEKSRQSASGWEPLLKQRRILFQSPPYSRERVIPELQVPGSMKCKLL